MGLRGADLLPGADADWVVYSQLSLQPGGKRTNAHAGLSVIPQPPS